MSFEAKKYAQYKEKVVPLHRKSKIHSAMKRLSLFLAIIAMTVLTVVSCKKENEPVLPPDIPQGGDEGVTPPIVDGTIIPYNGELASDGDMDIVDNDNDSIFWEANEWKNEVTINYSDTGTTVTKSNEYIVCYQEGAHVVLDLLTNSVKSVKITIQGKSSDGSLKIYGEKKTLLAMNGVDLTSSKGPAINNQCKKRLFVQINEGTTNRLTDSSKYSDDIWYHPQSDAEDEDRKGTLFSEGNLIISGKGSLIVEGNKKNGIATDNYYYQRHGSTVVINSAASNGIKVKGSNGLGIVVAGGLIYANVASTAGKCLSSDLDVAIFGGKLELNTSGGSEYDADENDTSSPSCIKADGNITISGGEIICKSIGSGGKGLSADGTLYVTGGSITISTSGNKYEYSSDLTSSPKGIKIDGDITIDGGNITISVTGKSDSSEGLESKANITINGGNIYITAYDDAINSTGDITINGGCISAYSTRNDGIDSNSKLYVNGGIVISSGGDAPEEPFDADNSNNFIIKGGVLIGTGGNIMTKPSNASTQKTVIYNGLNGTKDALVAVLDNSGKIVMAYRLPRTMNRMVLLVSTPQFVQGGQYAIYSGGSVTGDDIWGYYGNGTYSGGSKLSDFTTNQTVTTIGNNGGPGGGPGGDGPGGPGGDGPGGDHF